MTFSSSMKTGKVSYGSASQEPGLPCLIRRHGNTVTFHDAGYQADWVNEQAICEDRAGALWVITGGRGLQRYDRRTGSFSTYLNDPRDAHSLSSNLVNCYLRGQVRDSLDWHSGRRAQQDRSCTESIPPLHSQCLSSEGSHTQCGDGICRGPLGHALDQYHGWTE